MKAMWIVCGTVALGVAMGQGVAAQSGGGRGGGVGTGVGQGGGRGGTMMRVPLEVAPVKGAPYFAEIVTETVQQLADGNRIVRKTTGRVYRDSEGRTRRETDSEPGQARSISIADPVAGLAWSLNPETRIAWRSRYKAVGVYTLTPRGTASAADPSEFDRQRQIEVTLREAQAAMAGLKDKEPARAAGVGAYGVVLPGESTWEEKTEKLPARQIEGVTAEGVRTTRTIPAGAIGNEQPIAIVTEQWRSPELNVLVLTRTSDPRSGETTYRLTGITRGEPDATWFTVPADYTVRETGIRREAPRQ